MNHFIGSDLAKSRLMAVVYLLVVIGSGYLVMFIIPGDTGGFAAMVTMLVFIFLSCWLRGTGPREIGLGIPQNWLKTVLLGLFYAFIIFIVFRIGLEPFLENITGEERDLSRFDYIKGDPNALWKTLIIIWISAGFYEEVLFRGFLITYTAAVLNNTKLAWAVAVVVSSAIFALVHGYQGLSGVILTGFAALFLALLFLKHRDNLWILVFAHGFTDTSGLLFTYFDIYEEVTHFLF